MCLRIKKSIAMNITVDTWNEELAIKLLPNNVILSVYLVIGLCGNGCVIWTYLASKLWEEEERYFIPYLGVADLCASIVCASFGIVLNLNQATFQYNVLCKSWWFWAGFTTLSSTLLLVVIAVQRLLKLCTLNGRSNMNLFWRRLVVISVAVISLCLSLPMPFFYGIVPFHDVPRNITGQRCSRLFDVNHTASLIYGAVLVVVAFAIIISLIVMYSKIGYVIYVHMKTIRDISTRVASNKRIMIKLSLMFMLITVIFLICYIPKVTIMLLEANSQSFWEQLSDDTRPFVLFIYRMFIINNITNPFIYAFFDTLFLTSLKTSFGCKCFMN